MADELNLTSPEELKEWLKDKPVEWAQVIAARTALRVLPLVGQIFISDEIENTDKEQLTLSTLRACFISITACEYPKIDLTSAAYIVAHSAAGFAADTILDSTLSAFAANTSANAAYAISLTSFVALTNRVGEISHFSDSTFATQLLEAIWNAISKDAIWLAERGDGPDQVKRLAKIRLWPDDEPDWARDERRNLERSLLKISDHHIIWINWYNNALNGKTLFGLSPVYEKTLTHKIVLQDYDFWGQDFAKVSEDISGWLEDARKRDAKSPDSHELDQWKVDLLEIPMPYPATLEPEWQNGQLVLPTSPLTDDLTGASIESALAALKSDFSDFVSEIGIEANIDQRASDYLAKISEDIPASPPPQNELFSLAHKEAFFTSYAKTVSDEWPEFLAARFHALGLQFSRVMQQFPEWREFKANADQKQLSSDDIENIETLANAMEQCLREEMALDFVDQGITDIVAEMAGQLKPDTDYSAPEQADAFVQTGKDLLAADLLTSLDNVVKRLAEMMLAAKGPAAKFVKYSGGHLGGAVKEEYEIQLKKLGKDVVKWGTRLFKGSVISGGTAIVSIPFGQWLVTNYPTTFSWLEPILKLFV